MLIESFLTDGVGISTHFLSNQLSGHLKDQLLSLYRLKLLVPAGTGNNHKLSHDQRTRGDVIYWLDKQHNDQYENQFLDLMDRFVQYLNMSCYAGITSYEFHYTLYETGSFYSKHVDQFKDNSSRKYSIISYLNADWKEMDGGELKINLLGKDKVISPMQGKTVFFRSNELIHEVLVTHKPRLSVTGWLKIG